MKFLTTQEGRRWLAERMLPDPERNLPDEIYTHSDQFHVPGDAGKKTAVARTLAMPRDKVGAEALLWITDAGIWPSSENPELFRALRRAFGERSPLNETPCHQFDRADGVALECFLDLVLYFSWDATLYVPIHQVVTKLSHDEILDVFASSGPNLLAISLALRLLKLERL